MINPVRPRLVSVSSVVVLFATLSLQPYAQSQQPQRDTSAKPTAPAPTGKIVGTVLTADTGKPVKRARVLANAAELPGGRTAFTDDSGAYELSDLPAGRYTIAVSKTGFVTLSYGQRRPSRGPIP